MENLAEKIPEEKRKEIAHQIVDEYGIDLRSRSEWEKKRNTYYKLWACEREKKTEPWEGASNVCIPLMATACNQFHARSYQSIFAPPGMVKCIPIGEHDFARASNVEKFLNWQILYEMEEYEEVFDKVLQRLPINGTEFKKTPYDDILDRPMSVDVGVLDVVLPYRTKSLETARRIAHRMWFHYDELLDRKHLYIDFDKVNESPGKRDESDSDLAQSSDELMGIESDNSGEEPHMLLEVHKKYDLGNGIRVPYVFTVDADSETLLRCTSSRIENGTGIIKDLQFFTDYHFIPNPAGFYSFGFGHFLEPLNEMANTAFNQIFDSGRLTNQPFGFYGRRAGFKKRKIKLKPGAMYEVEDAKQVFFPSMQRVDAVLFQVLGLIQQYSEQFTSTSDYLMGRESKGTKTPTAHGTLAIIEQGLVTFAVITKRIFRQLRKELKLILSLNQLFTDEYKQYRVMEDPKRIPFPKVKRSEFDAIHDVIPTGDPSFASQLARRREAIEAYQIGMQNPLIAGNPESGQGANMKAIHELTSAVFETYPTLNKRKILPDLPEEPLPPESENAMMMQGDTVDPNPQENVKEHIQTHVRFKRSPWYAKMPIPYKQLLDQHIVQTMMMMRMIEQSRQNLGGAPPVMSPKPMQQGGINGQNFGNVGGGSPPVEE